ncbi:phage tail protein [Chitiniphilus shinanonensis]|uniref:phage tail protein n=1 Tax=Chitiniphilus shinanonensis TaxID=553088 RepID=UPI00306F23DE
MPAETFTWVPDYGGTRETQPRVLQSQFGDGYAQRMADGLNSQLQRMSWTFARRTDTEARQIEQFLVRHGGVSWFWFTPPGAAQPLKAIARRWSLSPVTWNGCTVTADFEQVADPGV